MNYFLILIIMGLCYGGYYEYLALEKQNAKDQQEAKLEVGMQLDQLESDNKKLTAENAQLKQDLNDARIKLGVPVSTASSSDDGKTPSVATPPPVSPQPVSSSNNLGTIVTIDGKTLQNCQLLKVKVSGIVVSYAAGITEVGFLEMPPELQKRFGFDPHQGAELTDTQAQAEDDQRKAVGN